MGGLILPFRLWEQMREDCQLRAPVEACGLVAGKDNRAMRVFPAANALNSPVRFRLDPHEQLAIMQEIENSGLDLIAIYHSHPGGPNHPSETDIREAAYPEVVNLIWCPAGPEWICRCFTIRGGLVEPAALEITGQPAAE